MPRLLVIVLFRAVVARRETFLFGRQLAAGAGPVQAVLAVRAVRHEYRAGICGMFSRRLDAGIDVVRHRSRQVRVARIFVCLRFRVAVPVICGNKFQLKHI